MFIIFVFILILVLFTYIFYCFIAFLKPCNYRKGKGIVLIIIAHPDDECMFFGPTILNLLRDECEVYLLCLSAGGFYNKSKERKKELRESCKLLGIPAGNVVIIEHSKLPDNPNSAWSPRKVAQIILKYVIQLSVNIIVTFDEKGVSGHLNHVALNKGLSFLNSERLLPLDCEVLELKTVSLIQKYLSFLSVPLSVLHEKCYFISNRSETKIIQECMRAHKSQYVWFRKLYIIFSCYVYINQYIHFNFSEEKCKNQ
ncbi:N-acetylglucosaminyl-phosphatidylinositol de-N-acetylase-like [Uloborus diversus]|uniref:N-acetylglucosaminyl-phosphatidylinositol de-N-acetylase-like n=1 Tax=Uloborus diversus TaxID=327109 RepID=UPI002409DC93|nr:N-acetylglucosaminyl-phosphatidylinositol de-N-acetylase-like [Uloborus diversus]